MMYMAHGVEANFVWAMDLKRAAAARKVKPVVPAEDLAPLFVLVRREHRRYRKDPSNLGRTAKARFLRVRSTLLTILRVDTGARSADMEGLPLARWRTTPHGAGVRAAKRTYIRCRRPKESRLVTDGVYWSREMFFEQNPVTATEDYWACAVGTWWDIYFHMREEINGKPFEEQVEQGFRILADNAFTDFHGRAIGRDRMSNTVRDLLEEAGVTRKDNNFSAKNLRHHFATFCQRLPGEAGLMTKEEVLAAMRHSGGGSLKYYTAIDVHPDVRQRYNNVPATNRRKDGRSQWLRC